MIVLRCSVIALLAFALAGCVTESNNPSPPESRGNQVQALVDLGIGYMRSGDYPRAKENFNKALALEPKSALAHNALALVFQLELEHEAAETHFKEAIKYDPGFTRARNNYGAFLFSQNRYQDAIDQLTVASQDRFYSARASVFENLGVAYQQLQNHSAAEQAFERAVALNPEQSRALLELATIRLDQQRYVEARELYRRYARFAPQTSRSLLMCVQIARVFNEKDEEASCALMLRNIFPASEEFERLKGMTPR